MGAKISTTESGATRATIDSQKKAIDPKNYMLRSVNFEAAENGVIASCEYKLKPDVERAMEKKAKGGGNYIDYDSRYRSEKHVFEDYAGARDFITSELNQMSSGSGSGGAVGEPEEKA